MKLVSSAYNTNLTFSAATVGKSFMYNKKNRGPRIEPCDTLLNDLLLECHRFVQS